MPFKPKADPETDYPERFQDRPRNWVTNHQEENFKKALGDEFWDYLEKIAEEREKNG